MTMPRTAQAMRRPFWGEPVIGAAPPRATGLSGGRRLTAFMSVLDPEPDRDEHAGGALEPLEVVGGSSRPNGSAAVTVTPRSTPRRATSPGRRRAIP